MTFAIVQVIQELSTEGGAETVAFELRRAWTASGVANTVLACSPRATTGRACGWWPGGLRRVPTRGRLRYLGRLLVVPAFTLAATAALRRGSRQPGTPVVLSHGDSLDGDVLVVHALNRVSLAQKRAAGEWRWRWNPMHFGSRRATAA